MQDKPKSTYYDTLPTAQVFPRGNYYVDTFGHIPNIVNISYFKCEREITIKLLLANKYRSIWSCTTANVHGIFIAQEVFIKGENMVHLDYDYTCVEESGKTVYKLDGTGISFYYQSYHEIKNLVEEFQSRVEKEVRKGSISLIVKGSSNMYTTSFKTKIEEFDVGLHYGKKFKRIYDAILLRLNTKFDKGIVLFHGLPGCGKTSLVKLLSKHIEDKEVIFVPPYLVDSIGSPEFIPFLIDHPNSILVIEDAEKALLSRDSRQGSSQSVSNILNLSDGILGDCLNIQIVATFNTNRDKIDEALLRQGRLICEHEFGKLSVEESNALLLHLGKDHITDEPMTLASIYGFGEDILINKKEIETIGFNSKKY